jgi:hypothetical protein
MGPLTFIRIALLFMMPTSLADVQKKLFNKLVFSRFAVVLYEQGRRLPACRSDGFSTALTIVVASATRPFWSYG